MEQKQIQQERELGIDALRIISMYMVVNLHVLGMGCVLNKAPYLSVNYELAWFIEVACFCAVNCFAMISGYVMVKRKARVSRLLETWLQVLLYSVGIYILVQSSGLILNNEQGKLFDTFFPVLSSQYWYFTGYFLLFLIMPALNKMMNNLNRKEHLQLLLAFFITTSILSHITNFNTGNFGVGNGYSFLWLAIMYLFGGFIKNHIDVKRVRKSLMLLGYFVCTGINWGLKYVVEHCAEKSIEIGVASDWLIGYIAPTTVLQAVFLVLLFAAWQPRNAAVKKVIQFLSPLSFGVYLIHTHPLVYFNILACRYGYLGQVSWLKMLFNLQRVVLSIFILCIAIDYLRKLLFKLLNVRYLCNAVEIGWNRFVSAAADKMPAALPEESKEQESTIKTEALL